MRTPITLLSLIFASINFPLAGMEENMDSRVVSPATKKLKETFSGNSDLISRFIGSLLSSSIQSPIHIPSGKFDTIIGKHLLSNEAIAFIAKRLSVESKKIGEYCSKPFELKESHCGMLNRKRKVIIANLLNGNKSLQLTHTKVRAEYDFYHKVQVNNVKDTIVTIARNQEAKVWDVKTGNCTRIIVDDEPIKDVHFFKLSDGSELIITQSSSWVKAWSLKTGVHVHTFQFQYDEKKQREYSPKISYCVLNEASAKLLIVYNDYCSCAELWSLTTAQLVCRLEKKSFSIAAFSPCGTYLITITENGTTTDEALRVWATQTGTVVDERYLRWRDSCKVSFGGNGTMLLLVHGTYDEDKDEESNVSLYRLKRDGKLDEESSFNYHHGGCTQNAKFSHTGDLLVLATKNSAEIWNVHTCKLLQRLLGHKEQINSVSFNKTADRVLTCDFDNKILIWSVQSGLCLHSLDSTSSKAFFVGNAVISHFNDKTYLWLLDDTLNQLIAELTFDQSFLINAIYEIIVLRRLAILRNAAQQCCAIRQNNALAKLNECLSGSFDKRIKQLFKAGKALRKKIGAQPIPVSTKDNTLLNVEDFAFDFTGKAERLLTAYRKLPVVIRQILSPYVKTPQ